jgi:hypothetical protein
MVRKLPYIMSHASSLWHKTWEQAGLVHWTWHIIWTTFTTVYCHDIFVNPSVVMGSILHRPGERIKFRVPLKADWHIACRAHAIPLPCRAAKGLECVFPIWFTQCGRVWFTLAMPRPWPALTMLFFSRPWHSTAIEGRPVVYLPAFGFFRLPRGVPWRLLSESYQSS